MEVLIRRRRRGHGWVRKVTAVCRRLFRKTLGETDEVDALPTEPSVGAFPFPVPLCARRKPCSFGLLEVWKLLDSSVTFFGNPALLHLR